MKTQGKLHVLSPPQSSGKDPLIQREYVAAKVSK